MNKRGLTYFSIAVLLIFFILIGIYFVSAPEEEPQPNIVLWERTDSTETWKNLDTGEMTTTLYSGEQFMDLKDERRPHYVTENASYFPITNFSSSTSPYNIYSYKLSYYNFEREIFKENEEIPDNQYTSYKAYFRNNSNTDSAVRFEKDGYFFTYDLSGGKMQWRAKPGQPAATDTLGSGAPSNSQDSYLKIIDINKAMYPGAFYNTNVTYEIKKDMLKENFILYGLPSLKDYLYLEYTGNIKFNSSLDICANDICYTPKGTQDDFETSGRIDFRNSNGTTIFYLSAPTIIDSAGNQIPGIYSVHGSNAQMNFWLRINKTFLENAVYPIYIDPTIELQTAGTGNLKDTYVDSEDNTNHGTSQSLYYDNYNNLRRSYITFNISSLINLAYQVTTSNLSLYILDGSAGAYLNYTHVYNDWINGTGNNILDETQLTWDNQPCGINLDNSTNCNLTGIGGLIYGTSIGYKNLSVTNFVNKDIGDKKNNASFIIFSNYTGYIGDFASKEYSITSRRPKLTITYTPYINIISPTSSQIFTQDSPTALLNISIVTDMDVCYWNNGSNNFTMNRLNSTYFYNETVGSQLLDGTKEISFLCNESATGTWKRSDDVSFDIDSVNVTTCRDLTVGNRVYTLLNSMATTTESCFIITNANITLDCDGWEHTIVYGNSNTGSKYGIYSNQFNTTIKNCNVTDGPLATTTTDRYGIYFISANNGTIKNINAYDNHGKGVYLSSSDYNLLDNITASFNIVTSSGAGIYISSGSDYNIINNTITKNNSVSGIEILGGTNNIITNAITDSNKYGITFRLASDCSNSYNKVTNISAGLNTIGAYLYGLCMSNITTLILNNNSDDAITFQASRNNSLSNVQINTIYDSSNDGVVFIRSSNNSIFRDSTFIGNMSNILASVSSSTNNIFINVTYNISKENISSGDIIRKWYYSSQVNYTNGSLVNGANVSAYNVTGNIQDSNTTNSVGQTKTFELIEYINNGGTKTYYTNYTINATLANWDTVPLSLNLTTNYLNQQLWINDSTAPVSSAVATSPPGGSSYTFNTWTKNTVKVTITGSDLASGFDNTIYPKYCFDTVNTCTPSTYIGSGVTNTSEGIYYIRYYTQDYYNNNETIKNQTIKTDFTAPGISIKIPTNNTNSSNSNQNINYTISDAGSGISSCWYSNDTYTSNISLGTSCSNITTVTWSEGVHNIIIWVNDSANNVNSSGVRFFVDTIKPNINIVTPANNSNLSYNNVNVDYTVSDTNLASCWYSNDTFISNTSLTCGTNITTITWSEGQHNVTIWTNDSAGNTNSSGVRFFVDTVYPLISYGTGTAINYANLSQNSIYVNVSVTETNFANITFTLNNDTAIVNSTTYTSLTKAINWTNLPNTNYSYYVNISDIVNNQNSTPTYYITLDTTNPNATLLTPLNNSYSSNATINFTVNLSDNLGLKNATLYVYNQSGEENSTVTNFASNTLTYTLGVMVNVWEGIKTWWYEVWDWAGNHFTTQNNTLIIDLTNPSISYNPNTETNGTYKQTGDIFINITASDTYKDTVRFSWDNVNETFDNNDSNYYWENKTSLSEGTYNFYAWINDSANNVNSTEVRTIYIDLNNPTLNIVSPTASSYNYNESINVTYTVSDLNLASCWWNLDAGTNTSITCGQNTSINVSEATHTVYVYSNDSSGRVSTASVAFVVNLGSPGVILNYPTEALWINHQNIELNYTPSDAALDTCQLYGNWSTGWHLNQSNSAPASGSVNVFGSNISDGSYIWNIWCNDSGNLQSWGNPVGNNTFHIDSTYPLISYGAGTEIDGYNTTRTWIYVNVSVTELNEDTIVFNLYNTSGLVNSTSSTTNLREVNWTNLVDEFYYYNITINDSAGNTNTTFAYKINLDDTKPVLAITKPLSQNYATNDSMSLNYTASDNVVGLKECWYYIQNSSGYTTISVTSLTNCGNTTFALPGGDINYGLYLFANDYNDNLQTSSVTFGIRTVSPNVVLYPTNNTNSPKNNNYLNFTATTNSDNIDNCSLYGNFNGAWLLNQTLTSPTEGANVNFSELNLLEGEYLWNVICYDNFNHNAWALNNNTFVVDTTYPNVNITSILTSAGSQTIIFSANVTDLHTTTCKYSIYNSSGDFDGCPSNCLENKTFTCNTLVSPTVSGYATYDLKIYATDLAGNENSTTESFTTSSASSPGGGGGGSSPTIIHNENQSYCGDKICQGIQTGFPKGNDKGLIENVWSCPADCHESFNFDALFYGIYTYCFDNDTLTPCLWTQGFGNENSTAVCGDNTCERSENSFICKADCGRFDFNYAFENCFDKDDETPCFYNSNMFWYMFFGFTGMALIVSLIQINTTEGRKSIYGYVALKTKKRYKRWRKKY